MGFRLAAVQDQDYPQLAWVAMVNRSSGHVSLIHGRSVEVRPNFFIEGVWNGAYEQGDFGETDCIFGTGAVLTTDGIRFVSSASTTDYLFYQDKDGTLTIANSLPLLLGSIDDELDPHYPDYPAICNSIMDGINDHRRIIPTVRGSVQRLMYRNLDVTNDKVLEVEKRMPPRFTCFSQYRDYLADNYALIADNVRAFTRAHRLDICSTQSRGYDSTAVNAIAGKHVVEKVFTVTRSKPMASFTGDGPDDDGSEICKALNLPCITLSRHAYEECSFEPLHYSALHLSQDMNLDGMGKHLTRPSVLLTGTLGEIWYPLSTLGKRAYLDGTLKRWDLGGHGKSELRLTLGFIHLPLPYIGARRKADIVAITESAEMDPWRLGTTYDRPIPRRIAEEAGVPRHLFGQSKMGSVVLFPHPAIPHGETLRMEFLCYLSNMGVMAGWKLAFWPVVQWLNTKILTRRYWSRLPLLWTRLEGALFCFCVNQAARRYARQVSSSS